MINLAVALLTLCGLVSLGNLVWIVYGGLPYSGANGMAPNFGLTRAEVEAFSPRLAWWVVHHYQRLAEVSLGWGLFVLVLAWGGVRRGSRLAWIALAVGGLPTLLSATFRERLLFGQFDPGSLWSLAVLLPFVVALALAAPTTFRQR